jgi:beta-phosphoglucomutase
VPTAFLFDLDGVIIDSMPLHIRAWEVYLERHQISPAELRGRMLGKHNPELVRFFWGEHLGEAEVVAHGQAKEALYREMMTPVFEEYVVPGAVEFIRSSPQPKAIGSNAEIPNIEFTIQRAGIAEAFQTVVSGDHVERAKPHPDVYLKAASLLGRRPDECIVFEDSPTGVTAARAAGMRVVGVDTGRVSLENVDVRVSDFTDPALRPWLEANV